MAPIVLTTHAMENVLLFDRIAVLMRGKLVFYGAPSEALEHFGAGSFKDLYDRLEAPIDERVARLGRRLPPPARMSEGTVQRATRDDRGRGRGRMAAEVLRTEQFRRDVAEPAAGTAHVVRSHRRRGASAVVGAVRQWLTLSRRYAECLRRDG